MECKTAQNSLSAYLDRELSTEETLELRAHLAACSGCRRDESELRALKTLLGGMRVPEPSADFRERLLTAVDPAAPAAGARWRGPFVLFAAVAAGSMAVALSMLSSAPDSPREPQARDITFEVQRDQVYATGADPYGGSSVIVPVDHAR